MIYGKGKIVPIKVMKSYWRSKCKAQFFLFPGIKWRRVVRLSQWVVKPVTFTYNDTVF